MSDLNPFDDERYEFFVVRNHEEQYSLWPSFKNVPTGWEIVFGAPDGAPREEAVEYIEEYWKDIRPKSLRDFAAQYEKAGTVQ